MEYSNREVRLQRGGRKIVRTVRIRRGRGTKSVAWYNREGELLRRSTKPLCHASLRKICRGKFVKGLFEECYACDPTWAHKKTRRR